MCIEIDNEIYRDILHKWKRQIKEDSTEEDLSRKTDRTRFVTHLYPGIVMNKYVIRGLYYFISRYKHSKKSKWISVYHQWIIILYTKYAIYDDRKFVLTNKKMAKLITRKRGTL